MLIVCNLFAIDILVSQFSQTIHSANVVAENTIDLLFFKHLNHYFQLQVSIINLINVNIWGPRGHRLRRLLGIG